jgi:hypothetical protein
MIKLPRKSFMSGLTAALLLLPGVALAATPVEQVIALTNVERANAGLAPLVADPSLTTSAQGYSSTLASTGCFDHTCGSVVDFSQRDTVAGYTDWTNLGENIALGQQTPEQVVAAWMASPGHRANILNPNFTEIGVGLTMGPSGPEWVQEFGADDTPPVATTTMPVQQAAPVPVVQPAAPAPPVAAPVPASAPAPASSNVASTTAPHPAQVVRVEQHAPAPVPAAHAAPPAHAEAARKAEAKVEKAEAKAERKVEKAEAKIERKAEKPAPPKKGHR